MIFKLASGSTCSWIGLYFNRRGLISRSTSSTQGCKLDIDDIAVNLPRVCRQIYAETATMVYSENCFAFRNRSSMYRWLNKRLPAQCGAIRYLMQPYLQAKELWRGSCESRADDLRKVRCPNLVKLEEGDCLDEYLCATPAINLRDYRHRGEDPSSGDESTFYPWMADGEAVSQQGIHQC